MTPAEVPIKQVKRVRVDMPHNMIHTVGNLHRLTKMTRDEFRSFAKAVRANIQLHLNATGLVPIEEQDPKALRAFLDEMKEGDPAIAETYPHMWPVLAYAELYLCGRRREYSYRYRHVPSRPGMLSDVPIWIRFSISEMTGLPLREVYRVSGLRSRLDHSEPTCQECGGSYRLNRRRKSKFYERGAQGSYDRLSEHMNKISITMQNVLQSVGTFIEDISPYLVSA